MLLYCRIEKAIWLKCCFLWYSVSVIFSDDVWNRRKFSKLKVWLFPTIYIQQSLLTRDLNHHAYSLQTYWFMTLADATMVIAVLITRLRLVFLYHEIPFSVTLTIKVLNFWKLTSHCSLKPLWSGMGEPARNSPTLHPPSPPTVYQLLRLAL